MQSLKRWILLGASLGLISIAVSKEDNNFTENFYYGQFPDGFFFGTATSAYQIEGAWDQDGKGESIWDHMVHTNKTSVTDNSTGDVAADSYHLYKKDVELLTSLGVDYYRFSLSWSRILPNGRVSSLNQRGVDYYNKLINELVNNGISPLVTLYHWDLPQALQEKGGWLNEETVDIFGEFADLAYRLFGDRVKAWITLNEPWVQSVEGYGWGDYAPQVVGSGTKDYIAAHNLIKAHARAWHVYNDKYRYGQQGVVGITLNCWWLEPKTTRPRDVEAAERGIQFKLGWFANPIFSDDGDYPKVMKDVIARHSEREGSNSSRLPEFNSTWVQYIRGTGDFLGLNHYTTHLARYGIDPEIPSYKRDTEVINSFDPSWPQSPSASWIRTVPWGIRKLLNWIKNAYPGTRVIITENGFADNGEVNDTARVEYLTGYINEVLKAVRLDGCHVAGYFVWSLIDNFEWAAGYTQRFGIHHVDFSDPSRPRTPKESAQLYTKIISDRGFPAPPTPKSPDDNNV